MRSSPLRRKVRRLMGLQLRQLVKSVLPGFGRNMTLASSQFRGVLPSITLALYILVSLVTVSGPSLCSSCGLIPSMPGALFFPNILRDWTTFASVTIAAFGFHITSLWSLSSEAGGRRGGCGCKLALCELFASYTRFPGGLSFPGGSMGVDPGIKVSASNCIDSFGGRRAPSWSASRPSWRRTPPLCILFNRDTLIASSEVSTNVW